MSATEPLSMSPRSFLDPIINVPADYVNSVYINMCIYIYICVYTNPGNEPHM